MLHQNEGIKRGWGRKDEFMIRPENEWKEKKTAYDLFVIPLLAITVIEGGHTSHMRVFSCCFFLHTLMSDKHKIHLLLFSAGIPSSTFTWFIPFISSSLLYPLKTIMNPFDPHCVWSKRRLIFSLVLIHWVLWSLLRQNETRHAMKEEARGDRKRKETMKEPSARFKHKNLLLFKTKTNSWLFSRLNLKLCPEWIFTLIFFLLYNIVSFYS